MNLIVSLYDSVLSMPSFFASFDSAINCGSMPASCFFVCMVAFGARAFTIFSNCALVIVVLQSANEGLGAVIFVSAAGFTAAPFGAAGFACGAQTPLIVMTTASAGTVADVSGGASGAWGLLPIVIAGACAGCGGGAAGAACPQASVPNRTHSNPLMRITLVLQDWSTRKVKSTSKKS